MKRLIVLLLSALLISCGTTPSKKQSAQEFYESTKTDREAYDKLQYGQPMEVMHSEVLTNFVPVFDIHLNGHQYAVDKFYIKSQYAKYETYFVALYKDQKLFAVASGREFASDWPFKKLDLYTADKNKDANGCLVNWYPENFEKIVSRIEANKIKLGKDNLIKSEQELEESLAYLSDEEGRYITFQDGMELAVMSPFYVLFGPAAVAGAAVTAPLTVPSALWFEKESLKRTANTPSRMAEIRTVPLGLSIEETQAQSDNIALTRIPKIKILQSKCEIATYQLKKSAMAYDVYFYEKNNQTYLRVYTESKMI